MFTIPLVRAATVLLVGWGGAVLASDDNGELFKGLRHERLFATLDLTLKQVWGPGPAGVEFTIESHKPDLTIDGVRLAVHPSRAAAEALAERFRVSFPVPPDSRTLHADLGDARYVWGRSPPGGTLLFLRENITVGLSWAGEKSAALAFARRIDDLLRTNREIAPRGRFATLPEIVCKGAPAKVARGTRFNVRLDLRGFPDECKPSARVVDESQAHSWHWDQRPRPGQTEVPLVAPTGAYPLGPRRLLMVAANDENVFVAKEFTIEVTE